MIPNQHSDALFDSHAHLDDDRFGADREDVLRRAREAGVRRILTVGAGIASCERAVALAASRPDLLLASVGIDPHSADQADEAALERLRALASAPGAVALGETGLDYFHKTSSRQGQKRIFEAQVRLAIELGRPLIVHCREAFADCIETLRRYAGPGLRGVAHCFTGGPVEAEEFLNLGFHISFSGILTYPRAEHVRQAASRVPLERLLIETDCPWLAPQSARGRRNEPAFVRQVAECVAECRSMPLSALAAATYANADALFLCQPDRMT